MTGRLALALMATLLLGAQQPVWASPLTYDFTGTFNQPFDGTTTFSGSFTINANPTVNAQTSSVFEKGGDVSLTLNLGGQVVTYVNTPQNPSYVFFNTAAISPADGTASGGAPEDSFGVSAGANGGKLVFGIEFYALGGIAQLSNLRDLTLPLNTSSVYATEPASSPYQWANGVITSIEPASVPEPSAVVVSAVLAIAAVVCRRCGPITRTRTR